VQHSNDQAGRDGCHQVGDQQKGEAVQHDHSGVP
jgi:hypothetical protein